MTLSPDTIIKTYDLLPHPEGGFYRESYRSVGSIPKNALPAPWQGDRSYSTAIYFLLPQGATSNLHRIASDEVWHFYLGGALEIVSIHPTSGEITVITLGQDIAHGEQLQAVVPAGYWFGAYPKGGTEYAFVGCTVAPGFDFADFELGERQALLDRYPHAAEYIERLTP